MAKTSVSVCERRSTPTGSRHVRLARQTSSVSVREQGSTLSKTTPHTYWQKKRLQCPSVSEKATPSRTTPYTYWPKKPSVPVCGRKKPPPGLHSSTTTTLGTRIWRKADLRVRLRAEKNPLGLQLPPQLRRVVDGPVVHQGDAVVEVHVRVRVLVSFPA